MSGGTHLHGACRACWLGLVAAACLVLVVSVSSVTVAIDDFDVPDVPGAEDFEALWTAGACGMHVTGNSPFMIGGSPFDDDNRNWSYNDYYDFTSGVVDGDIMVTYSGRDYKWWRDHGKPDPFGDPRKRFTFKRGPREWHRRDAI